jgi:glutamyl-tRNA synthetase
MTQGINGAVRVRFAPSPTGYLHIGGARTALFNWLIARKSGGRFILRIEDTDQTRHIEDSLPKILEDLRWLGLNWDEGPEVGGDYGPYFQSQRLQIYERFSEQLLEAGHAYYALETPEQLRAMRDAAEKRGQAFRYVRPDPLPTLEQGRQTKAAGRPVVIRLRMPDTDISVQDDILGLVTLTADQLEDFVLIKGDGFPTYHFACVVDDELMRITHVLRGQEHLMNTPRHIALQWALGFKTPRYAHLPVIFNMDGTKMSKRDKEKALSRGETPPEIDVHDFRLAGYLPEAVINFIALLGWSPGEDREHVDRQELVGRFSIERIGKTNARFDRAKLLAFNTHWAARLSAERLLEALKDYIAVTGSPMAATDDAVLLRVLKVCTGFRTFRQVEDKVRFLFTADADIRYDPQAVQKIFAKGDGAGFRMLERLLPRLQALADWSAPALDALIDAVCKETGANMGQAAQPLRVAVTGSTISPAIGETLAMLGKNRAMERIRRCLELATI